MRRIVVFQCCTPRRFLATTAKRRRQRPPQPKLDANFGIKPVDYSITPPIIPTPLAPPPRQGTKAAFVRMVWPLTLIMTMSLGFYIYMNEEEDNYDFWKTIETGGAIVADDDDDEGDYLDDDDEE